MFSDRLSGGRSDEVVIQVGWQGMWVASINPIERYTVAIANFHGNIDSYAPAALFKRIVEISFHTNLSAELGLRQLKRLAGAESDARRTGIPTEGGQQSDDCGQRVRAA